MRFTDHRERHVTRGRIGLLCFLMFGLPIETPFAGAEEVVPSVVSALGIAAPEPLIVQITLNQESKGEFFVSVADGDFLIRVGDLKAIGLTQRPGQFRTIDNEEYVSLKSIGGVTFRFDERRLVLDLTAAPALQPKRTLDLGAGRSRDVMYPSDTSAFLNYSVSYSGGSNGGHDALGVTNEFGARVGDFLFLTDSTYTRTSSDHKFVRLMSSLIHDRRDTLQRTIAGDFFASSGDIGTTINLGGLSFAKLYSIDPYFIRYPQQNIVGQIRVPSEVDVFVDGQKINTFRMQPGPFELRNITEAIGSRNVDLVVRDVFGREQRIAYNYYSTDVPVRAGLQEYSYNVGALRKNFGVDSDLYGPLAFSAFHRYGVTDALTLGARGEGRRGMFNAGPSASVVLGAAGVLNVAAAASENDGRRGGAALASYTYLGRQFSIALLARKDSRYYASLVDIGQDRRNYEFGGTLGYFHPWAGSFSVGYSKFHAYEGQDSASKTAGYSRSILNSRASIFVTFSNVSARQNVNQIFAGFIYNFDAQYSASINYQRFGDIHTENVQLQKAQPVGEGLGYNIAFARVTSGEGVANQFTPSAQYNSRWGILRADYAQQSGTIGLNRTHQISAAGGIAYVGDVVALGRPVTGAFGLVSVADVEGVPVLVNNQKIGETDARGRLFVPELASFTENQVSINAANVPLDYSFAEVLKRVSPAYRGGAVIDFVARRIKAITGTLKIRRNGELRPAEFYEVMVTVDGATVTFITGRGGEYYVEGLKAGRYAARIGKDSEPCAFEIVVPQTQDPFIELPELICEHHRTGVRENAWQSRSHL